MSAQLAIAQPRRIKATHRRRRKVAAGPIVQRYYDPGIGRFLSMDPVATNTTDGSNFNRYSYANNSPYTFSDPDGRTPADICESGAIGCEGGGSTTTQVVVEPTLPRRIIKTVEGKTIPETAHKAMDAIGSAERRIPQEYCAEICPKAGGGFSAEISTQGGVASCVATPCAGAEPGDYISVHNHVVGDHLFTTLTDEVNTNGVVPRGQKWETLETQPFSREDYRKPGYVVRGNKRWFQRGKGTAVRTNKKDEKD